MTQQVKDLVLPLHWLWLLLWHRFDPWLGNFCILQVWPKKIFHSFLGNIVPFISCVYCILRLFVVDGHFGYSHFFCTCV